MTTSETFRQLDMCDYGYLDTMRERFIQSVHYRAPWWIIDRMIDYTYKLEEVLISEGYTTRYEPIKDDYLQVIIVGVGRGGITTVRVNLFNLYTTSTALDLEPGSKAQTVSELLDNLHQIACRYKAAHFKQYLTTVLHGWRDIVDEPRRLAERARMNAIWDQCRVCHYSCDRNKFCGLGVVKEPDCMHQIPRAAL